jgi:hypothetical protein
VGLTSADQHCGVTLHGSEPRWYQSPDLKQQTTAHRQHLRGRSALTPRDAGPLGPAAPAAGPSVASPAIGSEGSIAAAPDGGADMCVWLPAWLPGLLPPISMRMTTPMHPCGAAWHGHRNAERERESARAQQWAMTERTHD